MISGEYGIRPEKYRLPESTHVGAVTLQVSNLDRSLEFYEVMLGFSLLER